MNELAGDTAALRLGACWNVADHVSCVRVSGDHAFEVVDRVCTAELYLRDTQLLATLLLYDDATVAADLVVARDDEDFLLFAEGMDAATLADAIRSAAAPDMRFAVTELTPGHSILSVNGPFAWELMGEVLSPDVIGLPYLSFIRLGEGLCIRAGKTGEYGYDLLVPQASAAAAIERLEELGRAYGLRRVGLDVLDQAALENWFFNIRREGQLGLSPLELQLQWRVSYAKDFRGAGALAGRRRAGARERVTTVVAAGPVQAGDAVLLEGERIGSIINAGYSEVRGDHVALALLERRWAAVGVHEYVASARGGSVPLRTVAPPVLNNRSLHVSVQLHSYHGASDEPFPDLLPWHIDGR